MSLNVHFKSQKRKVLLIMDMFVIHSLKDVGRGESFDFQPCSSPILLLLYYHLMLQMRYNPWIMEQLLRSKYSLSISFWNGSSLGLIILLLTRP